MLQVVACDESYSGLCNWLTPHDPTGIAVPVLQFVLVPLVVFIAVLVVGRLVRNVVDRAIRNANGDPQVRTLVHNVITVLTWSAALLSALTRAGLSITVLLTFGGVATLAIGLAFQDLLRNVLAGIFLLLDRPFRIGDLITVGDQLGTVQTISLRTTSLRTTDGRLAILPNLAAFTGTIINSSAYDVRQYSLRVRMPAGASLDVLLRTLRRELAAVSTVAVDPPPAVIPHLDPDAATLECRYWVDYHTHDADAVTADVVRRIHEILNEVATEASPPGTTPGPPPPRAD